VPLYVVATPIGNLEDVTLRALEVLRTAEVVACEDTRVAARLFGRHGIAPRRTVSYHEHNERRRADELAALAASGASVALVTNAGTPALSDPGYRLVRACIDRDVPVVPLPGASAALSAVVASGLPTHRFTFLGFPPRKPGARKRVFESVRAFDGSLVLYESPLRLAATLRDAAEVLGPRAACVARELTKLHEEWTRGSLLELAEKYAAVAPKGECTVVIEGVTRSMPREEGARARDGDS
jgi:16S rRNA (cytidine1402-2'-O)-methyltransferase